MRRVNIFFVFFITVLLSEIKLPQTWELIGGPTGRTPNSVIILEDGRVLCSTAKGVFISDDLGDTWRISNSSQRFDGVYTLTERKNSEVIAVTHFGVIKSVDKGENWSTISNISYLRDYGSVVNESPLDSSLYFRMDHSLYKSTDGGNTWNVIWEGDIIDDFIINEYGWMYISERDNNILISKDNGNTFLPLLIGTELSNNLANNLYSDKHGGLYFMKFPSSSIVHFSNDKLTYIENGWTNIPLGITKNGDLIYKSGNCIDLFEYSTKESRNISCPSFVLDQFAKNVATKGDIWIANFNYLGIHRSDNSGITWKSINKGLGFTESTAMEVTAKGKFIVSAFSGAFWGNLYSSTDDGLTWIQKNPPLNPVFYDIDKLADGKLVATGSYGIFTADKDGITWSQRRNADIASDIFVSKKGIAYTGTRSEGLLITRDNGINWETPNGLGTTYFSSFGESSSGRIFASPTYEMEGIYYSDDDGITWTHIKPFSFNGVYDFITKGDSIYAATPGGVYKSVDNGINWINLNYQSIKKFELAPNRDIVAITFSNGINISTDNGKNWIVLGDGLKDLEIRDVCFDDNNRLYALTDSGLYRNEYYLHPFIIKPNYGAEKLLPSVFEWNKVPSANSYQLELYSDSLLNNLIQSVTVTKNSVRINSLLTNTTYYWRVKANSTIFNSLYSNIGKFTTAPPFSMTQNYPNPFNAGTTIEYYVPYSSRIKIMIYNILGEAIATLVDDEFSEGKHIYNWDASDLSSGIYFIKIEGEEFRQIKKASLIK
ncbi:MAG: T9SS C-terminal target domain-containing protein [Ignavibacteriales bacterium]|nr:MAG: T9SS C-terminal target domain-containing protein [Ignavibacteriales bacterium]